MLDFIHYSMVAKLRRPCVESLIEEADSLTTTRLYEPTPQARSRASHGIVYGSWESWWVLMPSQGFQAPRLRKSYSWAVQLVLSTSVNKIQHVMECIVFISTMGTWASVFFQRCSIYWHGAVHDWFKREMLFVLKCSHKGGFIHSSINVTMLVIANIE